MTTTADYIRGLRALADWYEAHQGMETPSQEIIVCPEDTREEVARVARALGHAEKTISGEHTYVLSRRFGSLELRFLFSRAVVCTRRVVGTRLVPARPAEPTREEEVVEWDCPESILDPSEESR